MAPVKEVGEEEIVADHYTSNSFPTAMLSRLASLRAETSLTDVRVIADNNVTFACHRVVLAAASDFFLQLFQTKVESTKAEPTTVHLRNCDAASVQQVLDYIYSGKLQLDHNNPVDTTKVFNIAKTCRIRQLEELLLRHQIPQTPGTKSANSSASDLQQLESNRSDSAVGYESSTKSSLSTPESLQMTGDFEAVNSPTGSSISGISVIQLAPKSTTSLSSETLLFGDSELKSSSDGQKTSETKRSSSNDRLTDSLKPFCTLHSSYVCQCYSDSADKSALPTSPSRRDAIVPLSVVCAAPNFTSVIKSPSQANLLPTQLQPTKRPEHTRLAGLNGPGRGKQSNGGGKRKRSQGVSTGAELKRFGQNGAIPGGVQMPLMPMQEGEQMPELTIEEQIQQTTDMMMLSTEVDGEIQLPVDTTSGWCRNRKYIIKTSAGYQCSLCKKTYHRYNSTSYHVTIYHRNPPIRCDQEGCNFTTREARYIHFHKYYRHNIHLPQNIEVDSRSCTFCKHIAKSPAMLEKHINRHMPDLGGTKGAKSCKCPVCFKELATRHSLVQHMLVHNDTKSFQCDQCAYKGRTVSNLKQHKMFKHSDSMWKNKHNCPDCTYTSSSEANLIAHRKRTHGVNTQQQGDDNNALGSSETEEEVRSVSELSNGNGPAGHSDSSDVGDSTLPPPLPLVSSRYESGSSVKRPRKRQSTNVRSDAGECRFEDPIAAERLLNGMGPPAPASSCISSPPRSPLYSLAGGTLRLPTVPNGGIFPDFYSAGRNGVPIQRFPVGLILAQHHQQQQRQRGEDNIGYRSDSDVKSLNSLSASSSSDNCRSSIVYDYGQA